MKPVKLLFVAILINLLFITQASATSKATTILFQDDFDRPNNDVLGNGWVEGNEGYDYLITSDNRYMAPAFLEITDNNYAMHTFNHPDCVGNCYTTSPHPYAYAPLAHTVTGLPLEISSIFQPHRGERIGQIMGVMSGDADFFAGDQDPYKYYLPNEGIGIFIFDSVPYNAKLEIHLYEKGVDKQTVVAEGFLPFQIEDNYAYSWSLTLRGDLTAIATIASSQGSFSLESPMLDIDFLLDQVYMSTVSPESGQPGTSDEVFILKYDDLLVTQGDEYSCEPFGDKALGFCPPFTPTHHLYLPLVPNCKFIAFPFVCAGD